MTDNYRPNPPKVYVAPDGSRITTQQGSYGPGYQGSPVPRPGSGYPGAYSVPSGAGIPQPSPASSPRLPFPTTPTSQPQINVGLLVWGALLLVFGAILVLSPAFGPGMFQALVVISFAIVGVAFLALAYATSRADKSGPKKTQLPPPSI